jgi:regulator of cell morphogenesis and NO signaling
MMEAEHQGTGDEMRRIRELTRNYALPDYACATYRVCFEELQDFERDLHRHVHLENNVLFPRALQLEERLS